jgi:ribonucleoside-diphosphate reductase subunit M2
MDPLLYNPEPSYHMFPTRLPEVSKTYKQAEASFLTAEEVDLSEDVAHWEKNHERREVFFIKTSQRSAGSDGIVTKTWTRFMVAEVVIPKSKARSMGFQIAMENIHMVCGCAPLIDTSTSRIQRKGSIFQCSERSTTAKKKGDFKQRSGYPILHPSISLGGIVLRSGCVEGIFFLERSVPSLDEGA